MTVADTLRTVGRPIAYYPALARPLGLKAAVLCCVLLHWQMAEDSDRPGIHRSLDEIELATGMSHEEIASARARLRTARALIETNRRLVHRLFYFVDTTVVLQLLGGPQ